MSSPATSSDDDGGVSDGDAKVVGTTKSAPTTAAAATSTAVTATKAAPTSPSITAKKKRGRSTKNKLADDGLKEGSNTVGGDGGRRISDNKKARLHTGKSGDAHTNMGMEPSSSSTTTIASSSATTSSRDGKEPQTIEEIAASPYAPHMGILLGHRIVKDFSKKGDRKPENYLGTVVAYCPPWTSAFGTSDSDGAGNAKESSDDTYNEFAASSLRLWKGDDTDVGGGDGQSESAVDNDKKKRGEKKRRNGNKKKGKSTKNAVESRSLQYCRKGRKFGEIPGLYRILFDDGDFEDGEPNDVYEGALKYHKMRKARIKNLKGGKFAAPVDGKPHVGGIPKPRAVISKKFGDQELRRHANPPLRATVGVDGLAKARVLDVERLGYWLVHDQFYPGEKRRPASLVGSGKLLEWSEVDESGQACSSTNIARDTSADGDEAGVEMEADKPVHPNGPPKQKRNGPRKPERRRMMAPPAPSADTVEPADISASESGIGDDEPKQKRLRNSSDSKMGSASPASLRDDESRASESSTTSNSAVPSEADQESISSSKCSSPITTPQSVSATRVVAPAARTNGAGQAVVGEEIPIATEMSKVASVGTSSSATSSAKRGRKPSGSAAAVGKQKELKKTGSQSEKPTSPALAGGSSGAERERSPGEAHGLPKSSDAWLLPQSEHIPLSHSSAVQHKPPPQKFKLKIPDYQRLLTIPNEAPGEPPHILVLSVAASTIPNGGRGLFCTYRGPHAYWKVSEYVDLGCYGPHTANDIKRDYIMEIKNFLYFDHPSEWSFDAPGGITATEAKEGLDIHGKTIVKDMLFDITDDATGEVHEMAEKTLLPFVNEVTVDGKKLKQIQNVDSSHHDDGSLHYLLRKGFKLTRNKTAELFVYYGSHYDANRNRKHSAYIDRKESQNAAGDADDSDDDDSDSSEDDGSSSDSDYSDDDRDHSDDEGGNVPKTDNIAKPAAVAAAARDPECEDLPVNPEVGPIVVAKTGMELSASGHPVQLFKCPECKKRNDKLCVKSTLSVSSYTNIRKSMFTYSESDVIAVLDLFLQSPPIEPKSRQRMSWVVKQLRLYMTQVLYQRRNGRIPPRIHAKLIRALDLFPRPEGDPYHMADLRAKAKYEFLGKVIRKEVGASGFRTGFVEHIVKRRTGGDGGDTDDNEAADDDSDAYDDMISAAPKDYLVVFYSHEDEQAVVTEKEIEENSLLSTFGCIG